MAVEPGVTVEGLKLLRQNVKKIKDGYPKELKIIHKAVAEPVAELGARKVRTRSGELVNSIISGGTLKSGFAQAGRTVPYAAVNHWGGYPGDYQGNPFLTDALAELEGSIIRDWTDLTDDFIERMWVDS
jgi:hypothetical protein